MPKQSRVEGKEKSVLIEQESAEDNVAKIESRTLSPKTCSKEDFIEGDALSVPDAVNVLQGTAFISTGKRIRSYAFDKCRGLLVVNADNGACCFQHVGPTHMEVFGGDNRAQGAQLSGVFSLFAEQAKRHDSKLLVVTLAGDRVGWGRDATEEISKLLEESGVSHEVFSEIHVPSGKDYTWGLNYDPRTARIITSRVVGDETHKESVYEEYTIPDVVYSEKSNSRTDIAADIEKLEKINHLRGDIEDLFRYHITSRRGGDGRTLADFPELIKSLSQYVSDSSNGLIYSQETYEADLERWIRSWDKLVLEKGDRKKGVITNEDAKSYFLIMRELTSALGVSLTSDMHQEILSDLQRNVFRHLNGRSNFSMLQGYEEVFGSGIVPTTDIERAENEAKDEVARHEQDVARIKKAFPRTLIESKWPRHWHSYDQWNTPEGEWGHFLRREGLLGEDIEQMKEELAFWFAIREAMEPAFKASKEYRSNGQSASSQERVDTAIIQAQNEVDSIRQKFPNLALSDNSPELFDVRAQSLARK